MWIIVSQFILIHSKCTLFGSEASYVMPVSKVDRNGSFLEQCSGVLYPGTPIAEVYTVPLFDSICVAAQPFTDDVVDFSSTLLVQILRGLRSYDICIWYSSCVEDLDNLAYFDDLVEVLRSSLSTGAGEIYVHYTPKLDSG